MWLVLGAGPKGWDFELALVLELGPEIWTYGTGSCYLDFKIAIHRGFLGN